MEIMIPVLDPVAVVQLDNQRPADLRGSRIVIVDDNLDEPFTTRLEALLADEYGALVERLIKPLGTAPSPKSLIDAAARFDAAVVGIGL